MVLENTLEIGREGIDRTAARRGEGDKAKEVNMERDIKAPDALPVLVREVPASGGIRNNNGRGREREIITSGGTSIGSPERNQLHSLRGLPACWRVFCDIAVAGSQN